ncbi:MAG TPA: hypothetical protein VJU83_12820 [Burkholderiales bacterium]|nr:hypothetical protein [Burkholderiales bacterium]
MDPLSLITAALVSGATAALKSNAEQALKDAYAGVKSLIKKRWAQVDVEAIELDPTSKSRQASLKKDLEKTTATGDRELVEQVRALLAMLKDRDPQAIAAGGLRLGQVEALGNMSIDAILATPGGTQIEGLRSGGDMRIGSIGGMGTEAPRNPT